MTNPIPYIYVLVLINNEEGPTQFLKSFNKPVIMNTCNINEAMHWNTGAAIQAFIESTPMPFRYAETVYFLCHDNKYRVNCGPATQTQVLG
jgi:hypothetical protein